jgi:hypothetical protein
MASLMNVSPAAAAASSPSYSLSSSSSTADPNISGANADVKTSGTGNLGGRKRKSLFAASTKRRDPVFAVDRLVATALVTSDWPCVGDEEGEALDVEKSKDGKPIVFFKVKWEKGKPSWEPVANIIGDELIPQFNKAKWFDPQWYYHTKEKGWAEYSKEDAAATEDEYIAWKITADNGCGIRVTNYTPKELKMGTEGYTYRLDFEKFTQTNTRYGTVRNLQRRVTAA